MESGNTERANLKSEIQNLKIAKEALEDKKGSNDKRTEETNSKIET